MSYKRKIRIEYFQIVKAKKDGSTRDVVFDLETLILKANGLSLEDRTYDYYQEKARLDKLNYHREGDTITDTIKDIQESDGLVTAAEVNVKYNDVDPVDTIDLFSSKYHNFISVQMEELKSLDFVEVCDEIRGKYIENRDDIIDSINKN